MGSQEEGASFFFEKIKMNRLYAQCTYIDGNSATIKDSIFMYVCLFGINASRIPEPLKKICECQMPLVITNDDT